MFRLGHIFLCLLLLSACSSSTGDQNTDKAKEVKTSGEVPASGEYVYDVSFSEYQGASMGKTVKVLIIGDAVTVIFEGNEVDNGKMMKHKTGVWIIGAKESDKELDEIGGCTDGPSIIDFKNKKYWMC